MLSSKTTGRNSFSPLAQTFIHQFERHLTEEQLLPSGSKILVAVSGGPDSMALLTLLTGLREKYGWTLRVAHVNYGLRGKDSLADEKLVKMATKKFGLPLSLLRSRVKPQANIEARLREIRYTFFEKVRTKKNFDVIVTAHTKNDLAETFLLNLLRGSGKTGLAPFTKKNNVLVRPLLTFSRGEILRFLEAENIPSRLDATNDETHYTRNRIRHVLLPLLEKEFNPNILETLARTTRLLKDLSSPLPFLLREKGVDLFSFDRKEFLLLPPDTSLSLLSEMLRSLHGHSPSERFLLEVRKAILSTKGKRPRVENRDLKITVFSDKVEIALKARRAASEREKKRP